MFKYIAVLFTINLNKCHVELALCTIYATVFTDNDMDILKKEYQDLDKLLIPACEVEFTILLGEGK